MHRESPPPLPLKITENETSVSWFHRAQLFDVLIPQADLLVRIACSWLHHHTQTNPFQVLISKQLSGFFFFQRRRHSRELSECRLSRACSTFTHGLACIMPSSIIPLSHGLRESSISKKRFTDTSCRTGKWRAWRTTSPWTRRKSRCTNEDRWSRARHSCDAHLAWWRRTTPIGEQPSASRTPRQKLRLRTRHGRQSTWLRAESSPVSTSRACSTSTVGSVGWSLT